MTRSRSGPFALVGLLLWPTAPACNVQDETRSRPGQPHARLRPESAPRRPRPGIEPAVVHHRPTVVPRRQRTAPPHPRTAPRRPRTAPRRPRTTPPRPRSTPPRPRSTPRPTPRRRAVGQFAIDSKTLDANWGRRRRDGWQHVNFRGSAGDRIAGFFRRAHGKGRKPAVLLGHGHGGDHRGMADFFGRLFKKRRVHVLTMDHPFHGDRVVKGLDICSSDPRRLVKRFTRAVRDLRHGIRLLRQHPDVDPKRVGYIGFSLGAVLGGLLASHEPTLKAAALVAAAGDWKLLAASESSWKLGWRPGRLPKWLKVPALRALFATIDPARSIRRFAPRPLLIVVGAKDPVIHPDSGRAVAAAYGKGAKVWTHSGGHTPGPNGRREVIIWLQKRLYE